MLCFSLSPTSVYSCFVRVCSKDSWSWIKGSVPPPHVPVQHTETDGILEDYNKYFRSTWLLGGKQCHAECLRSRRFYYFNVTSLFERHLWSLLNKCYKLLNKSILNRTALKSWYPSNAIPPLLILSRVKKQGLNLCCDPGDWGKRFCTF